MKNKCQNCINLDIYAIVDVTRNDKLYLCLADVDHDDGIRYLAEVSEFDSERCTYFREKE
jgi:hypothetical protein